MKIKPKFITFEGGEGSGKTTQAKMLFEYLKQQNIPVIYTREVGGCPAAEKIRELFLNIEIHPMSELLLVMSARYEHLRLTILPALSEGKWVICDRFIDSTACYQGMYITGGIDFVYNIHNTVMEKLTTNSAFSILPDITFFMDVTPEVSIERTKGRINNNKFDEQIISFHQQIYDSFQILVEKFPARIIPIKADELDIMQIHKNIIARFRLEFMKPSFYSENKNNGAGCY